MAGVISRMTRLNRQRIENRKFEHLKIGKSLNDIEPFDPCFDPKAS